MQIVTVPDGLPLWTWPVRPDRKHDTTAVRSHAEILPALVEAGGDLLTLVDLGREGESGAITVELKKLQPGKPSAEQRLFNEVHNGARAVGEWGGLAAEDDLPGAA